MGIDELLERAREIAHLPSMAKDQIPQVLSREPNLESKKAELVWMSWLVF